MKRILSFVLCVMMLFATLLPVLSLSVSADDEDYFLKADEEEKVKYMDRDMVQKLFNASKNSVTDVYVSSEGKSLPYRMYVPADYDPEKSYPLVLFFHGAGERGNNNNHVFTQDSIMNRLLGPDERKNHPCIILAPQCNAETKDYKWVLTDWTPGTYDHTKIQKSPYMTAAEELLDKVIAEYSVDESALYVTGMSMGGFATWDIISRNPDKFAAAIPICGGTDEAYLENLKDFPITTFHAVDDTIVRNTGTLKAVEVLKDNKNFHYFEYASGGHLIWSTAYKTPGLTTWLFAQKKSVTASYAETENVTLTGPESVLRGSSLTVQYVVPEGYELSEIAYGENKITEFENKNTGSVVIEKFYGGEVKATVKEASVDVPSEPSVAPTPTPPVSEKESLPVSSEAGKEDDPTEQETNIRITTILLAVGVPVVIIAAIVIVAVLVLKKKK